MSETTVFFLCLPSFFLNCLKIQMLNMSRTISARNAIGDDDVIWNVCVFSYTIYRQQNKTGRFGYRVVWEKENVGWLYFHTKCSIYTFRTLGRGIKKNDKVMKNWNAETLKIFVDLSWFFFLPAECSKKYKRQTAMKSS